MSRLFSADTAFLGYYYQARFGLLLLLENGKKNNDLSVTIEGLDDVSFDVDDNPVQLIQMKHKVSREANLRDSSRDLWKTLRVWIERFKDGSIDLSSVILILITTGTAPNGSAAACLRPGETGHRDTAEALRLLREVVSRSSSTTPPFPDVLTDFQELGDENQRNLLTSIRVLDRAPNIIDVGSQIENEFDAFIRPQHKQAFTERVEGWWIRRTISALSDENDKSTSYLDLRTFIVNLRDAFAEDNLPVDFPRRLDRSEDDLLDEQKVFIEQLRLISASENRICIAISDYWRAYNQRNRWVADGLLYEGDLSDYEDTLVEEWERYFDEIRHNLEDDSTEDEVRNAGLDLFYKVDRASLDPIRPKFRSAYVQRGTFHQLANDLRVGWHRDFVEHLQYLVDQARKRAS